MGWFRNPPGRVRSVRRAAVSYAAHGWPVIPGVYANGGRCGCPRIGCRRAGLHPLPEGWEQAATTDVLQVGCWWARHAWAILLPTGQTVNVVELPTELGPATASRLGDRAGPIAAAPGHRWLLFCAAEVERVTTSEEEWRSGLLLHSRGSWVPVPSNGGARGRSGWIRPPRIVGWRLPGTGEVLAAARAAAASTAAVYISLAHAAETGVSSGSAAFAGERSW
ncbi:MAG TPA: bifunctional DNA primase/polymerase [Mycobacteriales bacterium]|nr:bifunctional DNA primase/polymerase [Mycobacteriales bacterium]